MTRQAAILDFEDVKAAPPKGRQFTAGKKPARRDSSRRSSASTQSSKVPRSSPRTREKQVRESDRMRSSALGSSQKNNQENSRRDRMSKSAKLKRSYNKAKAEKSFSRQFAGKEPSSSSAEGAPRAALYKTEMGKSHKRASRVQRSSAPQTKSRSHLPNVKEKINLQSPKMITAAVVMVCLIAVCVFMYPVAQQYYVTSRENAQLQAEYDALIQRKDALDSEVAFLQTDEGIEDRAREDFGWVKEGENAVKVYGLENTQADTSITKSVPAGSVEAPDAWYTPFLNFIFMV